MSKIIWFSGLLLILALPNIAISAVTIAQGKVQLYEITHSTGRLAFSLQGFSDASLGCNYDNQFAIHKTDESYKEILATILAAKLANREVKVRYSGCLGGPGGLYINVIYVYL